MRDRSEIEADLAALEPERVALMRMAGVGPGFVMGRLAADVPDLLAELGRYHAAIQAVRALITGGVPAPSPWWAGWCAAMGDVRTAIAAELEKTMLADGCACGNTETHGPHE